MKPAAGISPKAAVLLMAYGSPDSLSDIEPYLLDIRGGRPTPPALVEEIKHRYAQIGGRSPLLDLTRQQASALQAELNNRFAARDLTVTTYVGMRHWEPRIHEAVSAIADAGIRQVVALVMAPHASRLSTGAYFERLAQAVSALQLELDVRPVESWHDHPGFIAALSEQARQGLARFPGGRPYVIFSAHSLPRRILEQGDPYEVQLNETASLVAAQLGLQPGRWGFCYQSAGQSPDPWLGPPIEEVILELVQSGEKELVSVPIGFVCDHVEVLYDIDIACRKLAAERGARLERSPSLNTSSTFISALADIAAGCLA